MVKSGERMKILRMIEEGKISAEEGTRLLRALSKGERRAADVAETGARWLRVRVTDIDTGKSTVNVNLPVGLVNVGLRMGARFVPDMENVELEELSEALKQGLTGKVIDVIDEDEGHRVEVYVE
jgi:hypothetical protein